MASGDSLERWTAAMLDGDFERAWRETDRLELARRLRGKASQLVWDGTPFAGRSVLVRCYHGLGDTIQFLRYVPLLREMASSVAVDIQPELEDLFACMCGIDAFRREASDSDVEIECMELPYAFRTQFETVPSNVPYLPIEHIRRVRTPFSIRPSNDHVNVGLVWGSGEWNPARSLRLSQLAPLAYIEGVSLYSLQQGSARSQLCSAAFEVSHCRNGPAGSWTRRRQCSNWI